MLPRRSSLWRRVFGSRPYPHPGLPYDVGMTEPAVTVSHPPDRLLRAVNPALRFLLRTPLAGGARKQMMVLNFTGRKSGRQYLIPVSAHQDRRRPLRNCRSGLEGQLPRRRHRRRTARREDDHHARRAHPGPCNRRATSPTGRRVLRRQKAQSTMGLKFRDHQIPTLEEFTEAAQRLARHGRYPVTRRRLIARGGELEELRTVRPHQVSRPDRRVE